MRQSARPILGLTLYSFTNEWLQRTYTLEEEIELVAQEGLGPAVEVVGFQSFREFPDVSEEFAAYFRNLLERFELFPSCLGGNCDVGRHRDKLMTEDETVEFIIRQIKSAQKMGFPVLRIQGFVGPNIFRRIAPFAERARVHVAAEVHSPARVDSPDVMALRECFDQLGSLYVGFIPDLSCSMIAPPDVYWDSLRRAGASESALAEIRQVWTSDEPAPAKFASIGEIAKKYNFDPGLVGQANMAITMFGKMPVSELAEFLPYSRHLHAKFYGIDASGNEPSIPYAEIMKLLHELGFAGTISAEWEGHAFTDELIGLEQVKGWRAMCERLLDATWQG